MSGERVSGGGSRQTQSGMRHRPREDEHVPVQRPHRGGALEEDHDGEDSEGEFDESVPDVAIFV